MAKEKGKGEGDTAEKIIFFKNTNPLLYKNQSYINICLPQ